MISWHFNQNLWLWHQGVRQGHPEQVGAPKPRTIEGGGLRTIRRRCRWGHVGHVFVKLFGSNHSWSRGSWRGTCLAYGRVDSVASQEGQSEPCARSFWVVYDVYSQASQDSEKTEHSEMWSCFWFLVISIIMKIVITWEIEWKRYDMAVHYSTYWAFVIASIIIHAYSQHLSLRREWWGTCHAEDIPVPILKQFNKIITCS